MLKAYRRRNGSWVCLPSGKRVRVDNSGLVDTGRLSAETIREFDAIASVRLPDGTVVS